MIILIRLPDSINLLPLTFKEDNNLYFLFHNGRTYGAIFNFENKIKTFKIDPESFNFQTSGVLINLNNNTTSLSMIPSH